MKRLLASALAFLSCAMVFAAALPASAVSAPAEVSAPSAILIESETGKILFEKNSHEKLAPASVTKVMTMLLLMEALESGSIKLTDQVTASEYAASMGGSQIYLEPGEQMSVHDLLKSIAVSSANDACVAVAEHLNGSEQSFVAAMNERAAALGMNDTHFENCTGLDAAGHLTSAYDIAVMSRALLRHDKIREYTTIWMDSVRDGKFGLANTNRLVRFYNGSTGLKTGFTNTAGYCLSASAMRDGMELIAVIMHGDTSKNRFADASNLLNHGFASFALVRPVLPDGGLSPVPVVLGRSPQVTGEISGAGAVVVERAKLSKITQDFVLEESLEAPVARGTQIGRFTIRLDDQIIEQVPIIASEDIDRKGLLGIYGELVGRLFMKGEPAA